MGIGYKQIGRAFLGGSEFYFSGLARTEASQAAEHFATDAPRSQGHHVIGEIAQGVVAVDNSRNSVAGAGVLGSMILGFGFPAAQASWLALPAAEKTTRRRNATEVVAEITRSSRSVTAKRNVAEAVEQFVAESRSTYGHKEGSALAEIQRTVAGRKTTHHEASEATGREATTSSRIAVHQPAASVTQRFAAREQKIRFLQRVGVAAMLSFEAVRSARVIVKKPEAIQTFATDGTKSVGRTTSSTIIETWGNNPSPRVQTRFKAGISAFREATEAYRHVAYSRANEVTLRQVSSIFQYLVQFDHEFKIIFNEIYKKGLYGEYPEGGSVGQDSGMSTFGTPSTTVIFTDDGVASYREGYNPYLESE